MIKVMIKYIDNGNKIKCYVYDLTTKLLSTETFNKQDNVIAQIKNIYEDQYDIGYILEKE